MVAIIANIRKRVQEEGFITLYDVMFHIPFLKPTMTDHIFGLEGLVGPIDPTLMPNYDETRSVESLYIDTAHYFLRQNEPLWFLHLAGIGFVRRYDDLPSWVPDWSRSKGISQLELFQTIEQALASQFLLEPLDEGDDGRGDKNDLELEGAAR
jgi:hypothetical protein